MVVSIHTPVCRRALGPSSYSPAGQLPWLVNSISGVEIDHWRGHEYRRGKGRGNGQSARVWELVILSFLVFSVVVVTIISLLVSVFIISILILIYIDYHY